MIFKGIKLFSIAFLLISCGNSIDIEQDSKEIKEVLLKCERDWRNKDLHAFMGIYWKSDDLQFIGRGGIVKGYNNLFESYKKKFPLKEEMGSLSLKIVNLKFLSKNLYSVTGTYFLSSKNENSNGIYTLIFKKIDDKWVVVSYHTE